MKAIILCAGEGTRMRPITFQKPKPLLIVGGKTLLENTIQHLHCAGISDITLVVGYMAEKFLPYKEKYTLKLIHSTQFGQKNNYSSLLLVKDQLDDTFIIDGDLFLHQNVFLQIQPHKSQFLAQRTEKVPEWQCLTDNDNRIVSVKKDSLSGYSMSGVSYWTGTGARLLAEELSNCGPQDYWEDAALRILDKTPIYLTPCPQFQTEVDVLYHAYTRKLLSPDEIAMQCSDDGYSQRLKGLTNNTYLVHVDKHPYVLRVPGEGTERMIDRKLEQFVLEQISPIHITPASQYFEGGIKMMPYLSGYTILQSQEIMRYLPQLCRVLRKLHGMPLPTRGLETRFSVVNDVLQYESLAKTTFVTQEEKDRILQFAESMDADEKVLCHRDLLLENILVKDDDLQLIDFEYANYTSRYWDLASFITESQMSLEDQRIFAGQYGNLDFERLVQATIVVEYIWSLWGFAMGYMDYGRKRMIRFDNMLTRYDSLF